MMNKLTTLKLIAYISKILTNNMIKSNWPKYYLWICNIDINIIDWIFIWLKLILW